MDFIFVKARILAKQQQVPVTSLSNIYCILPFIVIYLFIYCCSGFPLLFGLFFSCSEWGLLSSVVHELLTAMASRCRPWALGTQTSAVAAPGPWSTGSIVVAHELSCSVAGGICLDQGLNLCLLHWQADSLPLSHLRSPVHCLLHCF